MPDLARVASVRSCENGSIINLKVDLIALYKGFIIKKHKSGSLTTIFSAKNHYLCRVLNQRFNSLENSVNLRTLKTSTLRSVKLIKLQK